MGDFDLSKEYGVVLEGGGAKGAYQIGVWKAMVECNVKIKGVSGVSVGALNGALMCMQNIELATNIWENIAYSQVMEVDNEQMDHLLHFNFKELRVRELTKSGAKFLVNRGFNVDPLHKLIDEVVDVDKIKSSPIEFWLSTFSLDGFKQVEICANEVESEYLKDYLLASAYFPAFRNERLHGKKYIDGGVVNNVPVDMLINQGYKDILILRIFGPGLEKRVKIPNDVSIVQIAPRVNLGNVLAFDKKRSKRNMTIGYYDGLRCFCSLKGKIYYIQTNRTEEEYLIFFLRSNEIVQMALLEYYKQEYEHPQLYVRGMLEVVLPGIAEELKLLKHWTYQELYLAMLELCAKFLRVQKYQVYTEEGLINRIEDKYGMLKQKDSNYRLPVFVDLILNLIRKS